MRTHFLFILLIAISIRTAAQTNVSGLISSNTTWNIAGSPYVVTGNTLLDSGFILTIEPGVTVKFDIQKTLQINGVLRAIGTNVNKITFTSNALVPSPGDWNYIFFNSQSTDYSFGNNNGSIMENCIVEYAGGGFASDNGSVRIIEAYPFINHCILRNNSGNGICANLTNDAGTLKVTNCEIYNNNASTNHGGGVSVNNPYPGALINIIIESNSVHDNSTHTLGGGIFAFTWNGSISIKNNTVYNNFSQGDGGGIWAGTTPIEVIDNLIYNNTSADEGGGIHIQAGSSGYRVVKNNIIYNNSSLKGGGILNEGALLFNNIFVKNYANEGGAIATMYYDTIFNNTIVDNVANDASGIFSIWENAGMYNNNTLARNLTLTSPSSLIYLYSGGATEPTRLENCNIVNNRSTGNTFYFLKNNHLQGTANVLAENTWWGTTLADTIQTRIWDYFDDGMLGIVDYLPFLTSSDTTAPVTPPANVIKTDLGAGNIQISWDANTEADLGGYRIYWGLPTGYSFTNSINVGNVTTFIFTGLSITDTIAVTAYDNKADSIQDMFEGHESWFTNAFSKPVPEFDASEQITCTGNTVLFTDKTPDTYTFTNTSWLWYFQGGSPAVSTAQNPSVTYNLSGVYEVKLIVTNSVGCDSIIKSQYITVNNVSYGGFSTTVCNTGYYVSPSGNHTWTSNGTFHDTIPNQIGCDSILTINLTMSYDSYATMFLAVCDSFVSPSGNYIWTSNGTYYDTIPNINGCDSLLTFNLTFIALDTSVALNGITLTSNVSGINYQWLDCNNGFAPVNGETYQSFTPTVNGNYAVEVSYNACADTSSCYQIITVETERNILKKAGNIYPNPASDIIFLNTNRNNFEKITINIYNLLSELVLTKELTYKKPEIDIRQLKNGVYLLEIKSENFSENQKLVIQR